MSSNPTKKIDRRVIRTRKAIMRAFDKLISDPHVHKITVSAIAREADIDRKTFYLHYKSVDELAACKAEELLGRILAKLKAEPNCRTFEDCVRVILAEVNTIFTSDTEVYANVAKRLSSDESLERLQQALGPALADSGFNPEWAASGTSHLRLQFFIAGAVYLYSNWLKSDDRPPIETVSDTVEEIVLTSRKNTSSKNE